MSHRASMSGWAPLWLAKGRLLYSYVTRILHAVRFNNVKASFAFVSAKSQGAKAINYVVSEA